MVKITLKDLYAILVYYADLATDILLLIQYYDAGQIWWFIFTLLFILAPNMYCFLSDLYEFSSKGGNPLGAMVCDLFFLRILYNLFSGLDVKDIRRIEASFESLPQFVLQIYIILDLGVTPTYYQLLSIALSIAMIAYSYYSDFNDVAGAVLRGKNMVPKIFVGYFVLGTVSRVLALAYYAAEMKIALFYWIIAFWFIELITSFIVNDDNRSIMSILYTLVNVIRALDPFSQTDKTHTWAGRVLYHVIIRTGGDITLAYMASLGTRLDGRSYEPYVLHSVVALTILHTLCYFIGRKQLLGLYKKVDVEEAKLCKHKPTRDSEPSPMTVECG